MNKNNYSTILDFGQSKLRLGVYNEKLDHVYSTSRNIIEKGNYEEYSKTIDLIIRDSEKKISDHLENIIVLYDSSEIYSIDLSIKKDFDQKVDKKRKEDDEYNDKKEEIRAKFKSLLHESFLDEIKGIGLTRKKKLLIHFGSVRNIN